MKNISEEYFLKYQDLPIKELINLDNRILNTLMLEIYQQIVIYLHIRVYLESENMRIIRSMERIHIMMRQEDMLILWI